MITGHNLAVSKEVCYGAHRKPSADCIGVIFDDALQYHATILERNRGKSRLKFCDDLLGLFE